MNRKQRGLKRKKVIRDIYTGKIINKNEAISLDNIDMIKEKEGFLDEIIIKRLIIFALMFIFIITPTLALNETNTTIENNVYVTNESVLTFDFDIQYYIIYIVLFILYIVVTKTLKTPFIQNSIIILMIITAIPIYSEGYYIAPFIMQLCALYLMMTQEV